ncbi:baseplate multidomain protein megatron [Phyllobacterium pellucidum]|uniref:baseplate multidomain protein megatron n=1 Tax=Phyllobacterium pellucidum TaxID=2740464 RepID=UPI001D14BBAB|nr:glycoside hydrolase/phage tail family protein [Phyllobacterium sp. T1018]UGY11087.1 glycoside hydrolase/phage tail family protein [Phyllobacterium sp. T1018]
MATIVLTTAAGWLLGQGTVAAAIGTAAASLGGYLIDQALFGERVETGRMSSMRPTVAEEGAGLPRLYGTARLPGTLVWATRFEEVKSDRRGSKGGPKVTEYSYFANFAIAVANGEISLIRRMWADGKEFDQTKCTMRVYKGSETQPSDPLIEAKQGAGNAPAYRGTAYVVFERMPVDEFGGRIPQFQFEVVRAVGAAARDLPAVALIPGATEFGLSPQPVTDEPSKGETRSLNRNCLRAQSDWQTSMDELQALCPSLKHVAIVVPWFGTDLRAGECRIKPGVMERKARGESKPWHAGGIARSDAHLISRTAEGAAYGGTPSDVSVIAAIMDAKARGLGVTLYPFIMLDILDSNQLPDPYGGSRQATFPWRGRITCHPAPLRPATANRTANAAAQIAAFLGKAKDFSVKKGQVEFKGDADDWGYRRMILHMAHLAELAGGVDAFLIGSELCGLTIVRDQSNGFPFVDGLRQLASDVRKVVGAGCKLTYAADWTEYFGHHPQDGSGDVYFHLDPLWAHPDINAVGIDNYMPLSDWRDEDYSVPGPDGFAAPYDVAALRSQIASGEGFDWYYASSADRTTRKRTPITDGRGKPWIYRYKDIPSWWENLHFNRIGGVESATPTVWRPMMKPVWLTELGCPAADKGPNQPNVFPDMKSSEGAFPYFSDHGRNDLAQNRYLRAHFSHWIAGGGGQMLDKERLYVWAWDTRPFPEFPLNRKLWADGGNWTTGHWLNGRLSGVALDELLSAILRDFGATNFDTSAVDGFVSGYVIDEPTSVRAALEPLLTLFGIDAFEDGGRLIFRSSSRLSGEAALIDELVEQEDSGPVKWRLDELMDQPSRVEIAYRDPLLDFQGAVAFAERPDGKGTENLTFAGMIDEGQAVSLAEERLQARRAARHSLVCELPWKHAALKPGDKIRLPGENAASVFVVTSIEDGGTRRVAARAMSRHVRYPVKADLPATPVAGSVMIVGKPHFELIDLPMWPGIEKPADQFRIAALAKPWRGVSAFASPELSGFEARAKLTDPAIMGELTVPFSGSGESGRLIYGQFLEVHLHSSELRSITLSQMLNGGNTALLATADGHWEMLQFQNAEEVESDRWRLSGLLRGQCGTEREAREARLAGTTLILLDRAVAPIGLKPQEAGLTLNWRIGASGEEFTDQFYSTVAATAGLRALQPLEPVHLQASLEANGDLRFRWIRRGRIDADSWLAADIPLGEEREAYRIEIRLGERVVRSAEVAGPSWFYGLQQRRDDLGNPDADFDFYVAMISAVTGPSRQAHLAIRHKLLK